jgi:hypothetical protein
MLHHDSRFHTSNTNLAACLGALRIPIKSQDPCSKVEDGETGKRIVTFYFEERGVAGPNGEPEHEAKTIAGAWNTRDQFETLNPGHALTDMRVGLEKLAWLTKVWHGQIAPAIRPGASNYETDDIELAACFMAEGIELHSFAKPMFRFVVDEPKREEIIEEFECYRHGTSPTCHRRRAMECRRLLLELVKKAPLLLHYTQGDPVDGGKDGYIAAGAPRKEIEKFMALMYE